MTEHVLLSMGGKVCNELAPHQVGKVGRGRGWRRNFLRTTGVAERGTPRGGKPFGSQLRRGGILIRVHIRGGGFGKAPNEGPTRDFDEEIGAGPAIHAFAEAGFTSLGEQARLEMLGDEVIEIVIGLEDDIAAATAVAATGATLGAVRFAEKCHATLTPMAGPAENFYFVNEHNQQKRRGAEPRPWKWMPG
jgi:hypothetical protein